MRKNVNDKKTDNETVNDEMLTYRLSVVVKEKSTKKHLDRHVDLRMPLSTAVSYMEKLKKVGFKTDGDRYFPDEIESIQLYELDEDGNPRSME